MFEQAVTAGPGTATYTQHTFEILIMLLGAFLLGLWLGWLLWSKYKQQVETLELENKSLKGNIESMNVDLNLAKTAKQQLLISEQQLKAENADLETAVDEMSEQLDDLSANLDKSKTDLNKLENELVNALPSTPESAEVPLEVTHSPVDVHIEDLADNTDSPAIEAPDPMDEGGDLPIEDSPALELELENPVASPKMALTPENLAEGVNLSTVVQNGEPVKKADGIKEQADAMVLVKDNLKILEGIGPKIEDILHRNNVNTYAQLAATPVSRIKEMLLNEGSRYAAHDPSTWPAQALLAANEEWENLKSYQAYLHGGRKPD
jgi:predicted flap endonuclease-1-like 5' DNA nuclease/DNA-binding transcriptional regulator of glucitol operon